MSNADSCIKFMELLRHPEGSEWVGKPFRLFNWQKEFIHKLFKETNGKRDIRECALWIPKKNGKTLFAAGLALYFLYTEKGGQIVSCAISKSQSGLTYKAACSMIRYLIKDFPELKTAFRIWRGIKKIECFKSNSSWEMFSSDAFSNNGINASVVLYDEIGFEKNQDCYDAVYSSQISRSNPLFISMSTAGATKDSFGYRHYLRAKKIQQKAIKDNSFLPVIYEAPMAADYKNKQVWIDCNPSLKELLNEKAIEIEIAKATGSLAELRRVQRYHLNQWVDSDLEQFIKLDDWEKCNTTIDIETLKGKECIVGIDLSATTDLTAMTLVFRENGKYIVLPYFYIPDDNIMEKEHKDKVPYLDWKKQKLINTTPGNVIDYEFVREDLKKIAKIYKVKEVAIDRWNAVQISTQLTGDGFSVIGFGQGHASMTAPTKELEKLILSANIIHNDNPILKWQISNLGIETDAAGNIKPSKRYSTGRIDGVVAAIMAIGRWLYQAEKKPSFDKIISLSW